MNWLYLLDLGMIRFVSFLVMILELLYSIFEESWNNSMFDPPKGIAEDKSILSFLEQS